MSKPCEVNWQRVFSAPEYFCESPEGKYLLLPVHKQHWAAPPAWLRTRGGSLDQDQALLQCSQTVKGTEQFCSKPSSASSPSDSEQIQPFPGTYHLMLSKSALVDWVFLEQFAEGFPVCTDTRGSTPSACRNEGPPLLEPRPSFTKQVTCISHFFLPNICIQEIHMFFLHSWKYSRLIMQKVAHCINILLENWLNLKLQQGAHIFSSN